MKKTLRILTITATLLVLALTYVSCDKKTEQTTTTAKTTNIQTDQNQRKTKSRVIKDNKKLDVMLPAKACLDELFYPYTETMPTLTNAKPLMSDGLPLLIGSSRTDASYTTGFHANKNAMCATEKFDESAWGADSWRERFKYIYMKQANQCKTIEFAWSGKDTTWQLYTISQMAVRNRCNELNMLMTAKSMKDNKQIVAIPITLCPVAAENKSCGTGEGIVNLIMTDDKLSADITNVKTKELNLPISENATREAIDAWINTLFDKKAPSRVAIQIDSHTHINKLYALLDVLYGKNPAIELYIIPSGGE